MQRTVAVSVQLGAAPGMMRHETFLGRSFLVIPAVLVRSQVLHNNLGRMYLPPDAFTDSWAEMWNGIPILVGPHPTQQGAAISGRSPALLETRGVGWLFNASVGDERPGVRRLRAEAWLDESRAEAVEGFQAVLEKVRAGEPVELSTGFLSDVAEMAGHVNGESYTGVMQPLSADHLIISAEMTGACSVQHGCGLGVHHAEVTAMSETKHTKEQPSRVTGWLERTMALFNGRQATQQAQWDENVARNLARELEVLNAITPSDQELASMLRTALQGVHGGQDREVNIADVFSASKHVVYWVNTPMGPIPPGAEYFRAEFTEGEGGAFTFSEPTRVRRMLAYEPLAAANADADAVGNIVRTTKCGCHQEDETMNEQERKALMDDLSAQFTSALAPMTEKIETVVNSMKDVATSVATEVVNTAVAPITEQTSKFEAAIATLTEKLDGVLGIVNAERDAERQALVTELSANSRTPFTEAELEAKPVEELRKIAHLAKVDVTSYAGRGAPRPVANAQDEPAFAEPVPYFAKNTKKEGE